LVGLVERKLDMAIVKISSESEYKERYACDTGNDVIDVIKENVEGDFDRIGIRKEKKGGFLVIVLKKI